MRLCPYVCLSVCTYNPTNIWMPEPILTKYDIAYM
jgi:hypothetical protein